MVLSAGPAHVEYILCAAAAARRHAVDLHLCGTPVHLKCAVLPLLTRSAFRAAGLVHVQREAAGYVSCASCGPPSHKYTLHYITMLCCLLLLLCRARACAT
jgi:hypothetical protein